MIPLSTPCSHAKTIQSAHCIHFKEERIGRFEGLPQFKWNDLGEQDVIGEGLLKPFLSQKPGTRTESQNSG